MEKIKYGEVKRLIKKCRMFKEFKADLLKKLNRFSEYPRAIDITLQGALDFNLTIREYDEEDRIIKIRIYYNTRSLIAKHCCHSKDLVEIVEDNLIEDITRLLNEYHREEFEGSWIKFKTLELVEPESRWDEPRIAKFLAWDYGNVAIWWEEQECGEHWIVLPTSWTNEIPPTFHRDLDENLPK